MTAITLSSLCLLMHLLQDEITAILVLENRDLQDLIKPQKVEFHSLNFNSTLHWQPGRAREARDTVYFVQYKVYGQSTWQNKDSCWGIQNHVCDLTNETSDIQEPYYGRVKAASAGVYSDWSLSCRFTPWRETLFSVAIRTGPWVEKKETFPAWGCHIKRLNQKLRHKAVPCNNNSPFCPMPPSPSGEVHGADAVLLPHISGAEHTAVIGPPMVTVVHSSKALILKLQAPRSPYRRRRGSKIPMTNYYDLLYQVFIINNFLDEQHKVLVYEGKNKVVKIEDLRPGVSYCVVAKMYMPMLDRSSADSSRQCTVLE